MATKRSIRGLVRRPTEMVESTRWLFAVLAMVSLAIVDLGPLVTGNATIRLLALAGSALLVASWTIGYLRRSAPLVTDVVDGVAFAGVALALSEPAAAWSVVFAALWFRSLYGSTRRAVLRCGLYFAGMVAALGLWQLVPGHSASASPEPVVGNFPTMLVTVIVARHLVGILRARAQAAQRDAVHAAAGARLLRLTDAEETRRIAWEATDAICAATPGLRVLKVSPDIDGLRVGGASGPFANDPTALSAGMLADLRSTADDTGTARAWPDLDAATGIPCVWTSVTLPDQPDDPEAGWLLLGAPTKVPIEVVVSVTGFVMQVALALRNGEVHQQLTRQAALDGLTGLANRTSFNAALVAALDDQRAVPTSVLFVDLDDFKNVNDGFGHAGGDELLREVARRIVRSTREEDLCARLGGDEFAVLLRRAAPEVVEAVAERIVAAVAVAVPLREGVALVGASVGVATAEPETTSERLVHCADVAMYAAKAKGKNRIQLFAPGLLEEDSSQATFERELALAAGNGQLVVHYQPVMSLPAQTCTAVEALVRWQHPQHGLLYPDAFIPAAERTGAIKELGDFVLRQACADLVAWEAAYPQAPLSVHVNISAVQLDDPQFTAGVEACLVDFGLHPERLVLEITESVVLSAPAAIERLNALATHGVTIAIDDFGTGYSALTTLRSLPVHIVKIDKSFVAGSTSSPQDRAVTEAVVQMAAKLGLQTVAEGVERPEQQSLLESMGVDGVQGYLYLRPAGVGDFTTWFAQQLSTRPTTTPAVVVQLTPRSSA